MQRIAVLLFVLSMIALPAVAAEHDGHAGTIWTCSMHPQIQLPDQGQCPICFMDLIKVPKAGPGDKPQSLRQISFDERARRLAQVEVTAVVSSDRLAQTRLVGKVEYDEAHMGRITAWVSGRIDRLDVAYTGAVVKKGQVVAKIYSPELLTAQAELIQAAESYEVAKKGTSELFRKSSKRNMQASKEKLRLLGLSKGQIKAVLGRKAPADHINITAPMGGIVIRKDVVEGVYVKTGTSLFTIADLRHLWVVLEAYESDLGRIKLGQNVEFNVEAFPGHPFHGKVVYIDPLVDPQSRTVRVRLNVDNPDGQLIPGMFVQALVSRDSGTRKATLLISASAPLLTGKRALVYVELKEGVYEGREVVLGPRNGEFYEVRFGLAEGDRVVSRGGFKIDSALQIQARPSMMNVYAGSPRGEVPSLFLSRLGLLQSQFVLVSGQVHSGDMQGAFASGRKMQAQLVKLPVADLQGDSKQAWQEMRMTLGADLFLLAEATDQQDLEQIYAEMAVHFQHVTSHFKLPPHLLKLGTPELRASFTIVLRHYLDLQRGLAGDDEEAAKEAIGLLQTALAGAGQDMTFADISALGDILQQQLTTLVQAEDLQQIRKGFAPVSETITKVLALVNVSMATPLYLQFCPMAFAGKGATWIADTEEINNPYFGSIMHSCGEVTRQLQD